MYIQRSVQHNLLFTYSKRCNISSFIKPSSGHSLTFGQWCTTMLSLASTVVHHWSKVNKWPEDGFVKAETCRLFEYANNRLRWTDLCMYISLIIYKTKYLHTRIKDNNFIYRIYSRNLRPRVLCAP
jgi:hypothetical protein